MKEFVKNLTRDYTDLLLKHFHHLHSHPELSFEEYETSAYIKEQLRALGIRLQDGIRGTSAVGILEGSVPGPVIAFRADMDALPIQEETELPYKSVNPGVMHACGHGSAPQNAVNPVPVACLLASAINQILAEKASPLEKAVLTVSYIRGGEYPNIIPSEVTLGGNLRTFSNDLTDSLLKHLNKICEGICGAYGCTCQMTTAIGYPSAINTEAETLLVRRAAKDMGYTWKTEEPGLGGEDFSYYLLKKPGAFFHVGMADPDLVDQAAPHHNCKFELDQRGLAIALELELAVYLKAVEDC